MQWSNFSPRSAAHCRSLTVPLTATLSSSPVIRNEIEPFGLPPRAVEIVERGRDRAGDGAFHVDGAAAIERAVGDVAGERRMRPGRFVAGRHHVGMAGEHQMRRVGADAGVEVLDRRGAGLREGDAMDVEARAFEHALNKRQARRLRPASPCGSAAGRGQGSVSAVGGPWRAFSGSKPGASTRRYAEFAPIGSGPYWLAPTVPRRAAKFDEEPDRRHEDDDR